jgi:hypothetical protein
MKIAGGWSAVRIGVLVLLSSSLRADAPQSTTLALDADRALGRWHSTERFEDEPRITVAFQRTDTGLGGWALLLGQKRKADNRATLGLSFTSATWDGQRIRFSTILPEDEGTIGWELRVTSPKTAVLAALTEDGVPIDDDLKWDMTR